MPDGCPLCGASVVVEEQDSSTGTMWRTYSCTLCAWSEDVNEGTATWKLMHDHNEAREAEEAGGKRNEAPLAPTIVKPELGPVAQEPPLVATLKMRIWRIWASIVLALLAISVYLLVEIMR